MSPSAIAPELAQKAVNCLRMLAADAVQKANSGHPGMPMGAADYAFVLWTQFLKHNPDDPQWPNRDRFVLSAGHGSMLLYGLLHLSGYELPMEQLQQFRQWASMTPGHPEYRCAPGVETTTGPLGQGFGNGVGMALASQMMAARFNRSDLRLVDHFVYVICSDGDLMEGVASEAASLAGHLGLGNLICLYDDNRITIEGSTDLAFSEDVGRRFEAYGWHVQHIDGHDRQAAARAIQQAQGEEQRPSLILCRTHIAKGAPHAQDTAEAHGAPLGEEELRLTKESLGWPLEPSFLVPPEVRAIFVQRREELKVEYDAWVQMLARYRQQHPDLAERWDRMQRKEVPDDLEEQLLAVQFDKPIATRSASGKVLQKAAALVPSLCGGSADLAPSTMTILQECGHIAKGDLSGRNLHFGVREHGMGAILNGMALYGGLIPYGATFLVFSDYMRASIRLACMMKARVIYVFTHDSIFVGEDGPTHQPVEQVAALRAIPNLTVIRPADGSETAAAWAVALRNTQGPTALILSRQALPVLDRGKYAPASGLAQGAYVISEAQSLPPETILIATGSEVPLALEVAEGLRERGKDVRVVSMPSMELFERQPDDYKRNVLPPECKQRVVMEAGVSFGWHRYAGERGRIVSIERFGASAPAKVVAQHFGFTAQSILDRLAQEP